MVKKKSIPDMHNEAAAIILSETVWYVMEKDR